MKILYPLLVSSLILSGACGKTEEKPTILFKDQRQALDKAKGVEQTLDKEAQQQREKIEEATQK